MFKWFGTIFSLGFPDSYFAEFFTLFGIAIWIWLCCAQKWILSENFVLFVNALEFNPRTYTQIHTPTVVQGGRGVDRTHLRGFEKIFSFSGKPLIFSVNKMRYILRVMALLEAHRVTNNDRYLGLYQELEIRLKPRQTDIFWRLA